MNGTAIAYINGVPQVHRNGTFVTDADEPIIGARYIKGEPSTIAMSTLSAYGYQAEFLPNGEYVTTVEDRTNDRWAELDSATVSESLGRNGVAIESTFDTEYDFAESVWVEGEQMSVVSLIDSDITARYHHKLLHMWRNRNGRQMCGYVEFGVFTDGRYAARCWKCNAQMTHTPLNYAEMSYERHLMETFTIAALQHGDHHRKHFPNEGTARYDESTARNVVPRIGNWKWTDHPRYYS